MNNDELFAHITRLRSLSSETAGSWTRSEGVKAQVLEFFSQVAGTKSAFYKTVAEKATGSSIPGILVSTLDSYKSYIESGLVGEISPERRVQLDVVSDFLEQAQSLVENKSVHPAAPIVLVGATLEEFLRTWIDAKGLTLSGRKPSLDAYAQVLLTGGLITKQDVKDITSWAGLRNHAAHGEWDQVSDRQRAAIMLESINLFLRKYSET